MPLKIRKLLTKRRVQLVDGAMLRRNFLDRKAAGIMGGFRVVCDPEILVSSLRVASAIASSVSTPSDASVWACRMPRMSLSVTSSGSLPSGSAISSLPSRSSGGTNCKPSER